MLDTFTSPLFYVLSVCFFQQYPNFIWISQPTGVHGSLFPAKAMQQGLQHTCNFKEGVSQSEDFGLCEMIKAPLIHHFSWCVDVDKNRRICHARCEMTPNLQHQQHDGVTPKSHGTKTGRLPLEIFGTVLTSVKHHLSMWRPNCLTLKPRARTTNMDVFTHDRTRGDFMDVT